MTPAEIVDGLHLVQGILGVSHFRGERITEEEMQQAYPVLAAARAALKDLGDGFLLAPDEADLARRSVETRIRDMENGLLPSSEDTYPALCALAARLGSVAR